MPGAVWHFLRKHILDQQPTTIYYSGARWEFEAEVWDGLRLYAATASGGLYEFGEYKIRLESAGFVSVQDFNQGPIKAVKLSSC